ILDPPPPALVLHRGSHGQMESRRAELAEALRESIQLTTQLWSPPLTQVLGQIAIAMSPLSERIGRGKLDGGRCVARTADEDVHGTIAHLRNFVSRRKAHQHGSPLAV